MALFAAARALDMAIRIEEHGAAFYRAAGAKTDDDTLRQVFADLAAREDAHRQIFQGMAEALEPASKPPSSDVGDYESFLTVALDHAVLSGPDKALHLAEQADDRQAALRAAMGFEKDTMLFYYDLQELLDERDRDVISDIIREEKQHLRRLASLVEE